FLVCIAASTLAISLAVWFWLPGVTDYRGLSGVDSALFGLLFVETWSDADRAGEGRQAVVAVACFAVFVLKICFEVATGTNLLVHSAGSGTIAVPLAHIAGAGVGFLVGRVAL